ncbi:MAG: efflux RND transporter permease subunit [Clostridia bacterium]|nr:efflux RND transporter permease subunit [Clostridia bacterium]
MKDLDEKQLKINIFGKISGKFIKEFQLSILVILLIVAVGFVGLLSLPKESLPEIVFPSVTIQTLFPGANPEDVEFLVTEKIENKIKDFDEVSDITSESIFGLSSVTVVFNDGVDINLKKIEIDNALDELYFADGVFPPKAFIFSTSEIPLMNLSVTGDYSQDELTYIAKDVANKIQSVPGVDSVILSGDVEREIEVVIKDLSMMRNKISFNDLRNILSAQNYTTPIGELDLNGVRYNLRVDERFTSVEDIKKTNITPEITVEDVADVYDAVAPIKTYSRTYVRGINDESQPSIFLTISRKVGSDVISTTDAIENLINDGRGQLYPEDVNIIVSNALKDNVENDLSKIQSSAWSGLIVVIIVLFLFIGIKESLIVSITIPLSLLGTLGLLNAFGITFNTFAVLGLIVALGLLVDNSIIVMENIDRLRRKGFNSMDAALYGTNQVGFPIASSTLTTLAAFFPLAILPGILGAFVSTIPITIMITISVSLFVSIVITPSLASKILKKSKKVKINSTFYKIVSVIVVAFLSGYAFYNPDNFILMFVMMGIFTSLMILKLIYVGENGLEESKITLGYSKMLQWIVSKKKRSSLVLSLGILVLIFSFGTFSTGLLKIAFFPKGEPTSATIKIDTVGGTTLYATDQVVSKVETVLYDLPSIKQFSTTIGGNEIDFAKIAVEIDTDNQNGFEVVESIEQAISKIPGAKMTIESIVAGPPVGKPIELKVVGDDLRSNETLANELMLTLKQLNGVYNIESSATQGVPQLLIDIDKNMGLNYGLTALQIGNQLRGELTGVKATTIRSGNEFVDVYIRKDKSFIENINEVENLYVATPYSNMLILKNVSSLVEETGISNISRENGERLITISADVRNGVNVNEIIDQIKAIYPEDALMKNVSIKYAGDVEGIEQNFGNLFQSMILAVFLVFLILTIQFNSIKQPFIVLTTIPMAVIGVIWGLILTGNEFGFYAFMGLIALVGIAVNDAIVLIDYINYLRTEGYDLVSSIKEAGKTRFNPVLATTLTTISGVLPLAFKEAYYAQFSFALIFGLLVTTILTLVFIPAIYNLFTKRERVI